MNVGELFIELGFDVDEQKLKDFDAGIAGLERHMLSLTAVATGSVLGIDAFLSKVADRATSMKQFGDQTGYSTQMLQEWALVINRTNPLISIEDAQAKYKAFTDYVRNINWGAGGGAILSQLGVDYVAGATPDQYLDRLSQKLPAFIAQFGRARASMLLDQIGIGAGSIDALLTTRGQRDSMTAGLLLPDREIEHIDQINQKLAEFNQKWQKFEADLADKWGDTFIEYLNKIINLMNVWIPMLNSAAQAVGGWKVVGEAVLGYFAVSWASGMLASFTKVSKGLIGLVGGIGRTGLGLLGVDAAGMAAGGAALAGGAGLAAGGYLAYWLDQQFGYGQKFADWLAPVRVPDHRDFLMPRDVGSSTNTLNMQIHSNADPGTIGREAARAWEDWLSRKVTGASSGLSRGPVY